MFFKITLPLVLTSYPLFDESAALAQYVTLTLKHTHTDLSLLVGRGQAVFDCENLTVGPAVQYAAAAFPLLLQRITAVERTSLYPQSWNACPAPRLWGNSEPKVNGTTEQWTATGISHFQSSAPTGFTQGGSSG